MNYFISKIEVTVGKIIQDIDKLNEEIYSIDNLIELLFNMK